MKSTTAAELHATLTGAKELVLSFCNRGYLRRLMDWRGDQKRFDEIQERLDRAIHDAHFVITLDSRAWEAAQSADGLHAADLLAKLLAGQEQLLNIQVELQTTGTFGRAR